MLLKPAPLAQMHVGQVLEMHITTEAATGEPIYPLPQSPDDQILRFMAQADNGATGRYEAVGPGTIALKSNGLCLDSVSDVQTNGPCPVLTLTVTN